MPKSRNRSRDAKKRAKRKRANRERLQRREKEVRIETSKLMDIAHIDRATALAVLGKDKG